MCAPIPQPQSIVIFGISYKDCKKNTKCWSSTIIHFLNIASPNPRILILRSVNLCLLSYVHFWSVMELCTQLPMPFAFPGMSVIVICTVHILPTVQYDISYSMWQFRVCGWSPGVGLEWSQGCFDLSWTATLAWSPFHILCFFCILS